MRVTIANPEAMLFYWNTEVVRGVRPLPQVKEAKYFWVLFMREGVWRVVNSSVGVAPDHCG